MKLKLEEEEKNMSAVDESTEQNELPINSHSPLLSFYCDFKTLKGIMLTLIFNTFSQQIKNKNNDGKNN